MADVDNGSIQVLITPLGGASPSGDSANAIRDQLQTALAGKNGITVNVMPAINVTEFTQAIQTQLKAGIKINVTPNIVGGKDSGGIPVSDFNGMVVSTRKVSQATAELTLQKKKLTQETHNEELAHKKAMRALQEEAQRARTATSVANEQLKQRKLNATEADKEAAAIARVVDQLDVYRMKAYNATGGILSDSGNVNYSAMSQQYSELGRLLYEYQARGTQLSKTEAQGINERIAALRQLHTASNQYYKTQEANSKKADADNKRNAATLADMQLELSKFNQYLASVNPKALTQFSGQISNIRDLLSSGIPDDGKVAANAMKTLKASIKDAGYEGGTAFSVLANKMKEYGKYLISSAVVMGATKALSQLISNVKTLDGALTDLRIVTGGTREETEELLDSYSELAQKLGATTTSVAEGAADWLRQGYTGDQAETLLTQSMTLSIVGDMDSTSATEALTSAIKGNCKYSLCVQKCA